MPTSSGSSYFNRLVHNTRRAVTRRSRRSAEPTITTASPISPIDVFTPSNVLGMFDNNNVPITSTYRPPETPYLAQSYHLDDFNIEPGPSHFHNYSQPGYQTNHYTISAWTKDFTGQDVYVGHGKIEEVRSDVEESANHPRLLNAGDHESNELLNDEVAFLSPPPCPRPRNLPSLQPTPTGSDFMNFKTTSVPAATATTIGNSSERSLPIEVHLVTNNLAMVESSLEDVQFMNTVRVCPRTFDAQSDHLDF